MNYNKKHTHKYIKKTFPNGKPFYACGDSDCNHYLHLFQMTLKTRESRCWYCDKTFEITKQMLADGTIKFHCKDCNSPRGFGRKRYLEQVAKRAKVDEDTRIFQTEKMMNDILGSIKQEETDNKKVIGE